jgi:hypothetical protein
LLKYSFSSRLNCSNLRILHLRNIQPVLLAALLLSGCGSIARQVTSSGVPVSGAALKGRVHGGQQAITGATIQIYAASTSGDGTPATPLIQSVVKTDSAGNFNVSGTYTCPSYATPVYIVASGGNPGLAPGMYNSGIAEMTALGPCGALNSSSTVAINELTTVASVFPLATFMQSYSTLGSGASDEAQLTAAFNQVNELVDVSKGTTPGPALPAGATSPVQALDTLADIVSSCIYSGGGTTGDGTACGNLYAAATVPGLPAPTDTVGAAILIATHPTNNVGTLFSLAPATAPFEPTLVQAPASWQISVGQSASGGVPEQNHLLGEYLLQEGQGSIAVDSSGAKNDGNIVNAPWEGSTDVNLASAGAYVAVPSSLNATKTWMIAYYQAPWGHLTAPQAPGYGDLASFEANPSLLCHTTSGGPCWIASTEAYAGRSQRFAAFGTDKTELAQPVSAGWHVWTMICGGNVGGAIAKTHYLIDGVEAPYLTQGDVNTCPVPTSGNYQIGYSSAYDQVQFFGKVAGIWAWDTQLSLAEGAAAAATALDFIHSKGVPTSYPAVVSATPRVLAGFDSRTSGVGMTTATAWPALLALTDSTYQVIPFTSPGLSAYDGCPMFDLTFGQMVGQGSGPVIFAWLGGVDDLLLFPTRTPEQSALDMKCMVMKAKALGAKVVLATEISGRSSAGVVDDAGRDKLNAIMRAQAYSWGVDNLADLATELHLGPDGAYANTYCFPDGLHPSQSCEPYLAGVMQNAINELLGSTASSHHSTNSSTYNETAGDRFLDLNGGTAQTVILPSCIGYSMSRQVNNLGSATAMVYANTGEVLTGSGVVGAGTSATFIPVPGPSSTAGCSWQMQ